MGFYQDAKPKQQQLLGIAENRLREVLAGDSPAFWQLLADAMGEEKVLALAVSLAREEKAHLEGVVAGGQAEVEAVAAALTAVEVA